MTNMPKDEAALHIQVLSVLFFFLPVDISSK